MIFFLGFLNPFLLLAAIRGYVTCPASRDDVDRLQQRQDDIWRVGRPRDVEVWGECGKDFVVATDTQGRG
ncbi:hypothetical protein ACFY12_14245 [Streptomyces sp. NPDC001339]|uniref:hypothetical protein n=1 Tax=Streptomyces sp. NPDC001339 TaxID=3364563 RepID=UPI0036BED614